MFKKIATFLLILLISTLTPFPSLGSLFFSGGHGNGFFLGNSVSPFYQSYNAGYTCTQNAGMGGGTSFCGGTEARYLVAHTLTAGSTGCASPPCNLLFAGISYWENNPGPEGQQNAQVLTLASSRGTWTKDWDFTVENLSIAAMCEVTINFDSNGAAITQDQNGNSASSVKILLAGMWDRPSQPNLIQMYERNDATGTWSQTILGTVSSLAPNPQMRSCGAYDDNGWTGYGTGTVTMVFAGDDATGIYSGSYNSSTKKIVWNNSPASFTGAISGTTLTASSVTGTIVTGSIIGGTNIALGTTITGRISGTGGAGTYTVSVSQTTPATGTEAMNTFLPELEYVNLPTYPGPVPADLGVRAMGMVFCDGNFYVTMGFQMMGRTTGGPTPAWTLTNNEYLANTIGTPISQSGSGYRGLTCVHNPTNGSPTNVLIATIEGTTDWAVTVDPTNGNPNGNETKDTSITADLASFFVTTGSVGYTEAAYNNLTPFGANSQLIGTETVMTPTQISNGKPGLCTYEKPAGGEHLQCNAYYLVRTQSGASAATYVVHGLPAFTSNANFPETSIRTIVASPFGDSCYYFGGFDGNDDTTSPWEDTAWIQIVCPVSAGILP